MEKHVLYLMLQVMQWLDVRLAQLDRAFGYGPKGRGLESSNARYKIKRRDAKAPLLFILQRPLRLRTRGSVYATLRSVQCRGPPDLVHPLTHVACAMSLYPGFGLRYAAVGAMPRSVS